MPAVERPEDQAMIQTILRTVETEILPSVATKEFFQEIPFWASPRADGEAPLFDRNVANPFLHDVILPALTREPTTAACATLLSGMDFGQRCHLWTQQGLGTMIHKAHCLWREHYRSSIHQAVDSFLKLGKVSTKTSIKWARELFTATEQGSLARPLGCRGVQSILMTLYTCPERGSGAALRAGGAKDKDKDMWAHDKLHARSIREIYSSQEEAFVLLIIRKYLLVKFGRHSMYATVGPLVPGNAMTVIPALLAPAPALPEILEEDEDVAISIEWEGQDVEYFIELCKTLESQDTLKETSVLFGGLYDVFSIPRCSSSNSTADKEDTSAGRTGMDSSPGRPRKKIRLSLRRRPLRSV